MSPGGICFSRRGRVAFLRRREARMRVSFLDGENGRHGLHPRVAGKSLIVQTSEVVAMAFVGPKW